jgi:hypothetical protein
MIGFTQSLLPIHGEGDHDVLKKRSVSTLLRVVEGLLSAVGMTPPSARFTRIHLPMHGEEK